MQSEVLTCFLPYFGIYPFDFQQRYACIVFRECANKKQYACLLIFSRGGTRVRLAVAVLLKRLKILLYFCTEIYEHSTASDYENKV
jgi:hypothetical protein